MIQCGQFYMLNMERPALTDFAQNMREGRELNAAHVMTEN